ncbi:hypothetical protein Tco_0638252 [Tanacetum coccineum]
MVEIRSTGQLTLTIFTSSSFSRLLFDALGPESTLRPLTASALTALLPHLLHPGQPLGSQKLISGLLCLSDVAPVRLGHFNDKKPHLKNFAQQDGLFAPFLLTLEFRYRDNVVSVLVSLWWKLAIHKDNGCRVLVGRLPTQMLELVGTTKWLLQDKNDCDMDGAVYTLKLVCCNILTLYATHKRSIYGLKQASRHGIRRFDDENQEIRCFAVKNLKSHVYYLKASGSSTVAIPNS